MATSEVCGPRSQAADSATELGNHRVGIGQPTAIVLSGYLPGPASKAWTPATGSTERREPLNHSQYQFHALTCLSCVNPLASPLWPSAEFNIQRN
ncbi:hypothetical protein RRG08_041774 [Elysia crispata]|uniref:Uncharacterized protein n=1 Tax=Elysia crispata TaxID=231223 RepID=A0AAE0YJU0_9GAST|nr:hypothetical protein RRG08_041774 [Elysia crispata]